MKILSMPSVTNPAIIISGNTINYACDNTLAPNGAYMRFSYPNSPHIYNVDMTNFSKLSITCKNGASGGSCYVRIDGTDIGSIDIAINLPSDNIWIGHTIAP